MVCQTDDDHGSVIGSIPPFEIIPDTAKWCLFDLDNHRYSIQNVYSQYFLDTETRPEEYANVRGSRPGNRQYTWKIVESETAGQYFIFAENPTTLCWALSDESDKTPIELRGVSSDPRNLWKIISLDAEAKQLPFADKLGVCLKEALIRPGSENFTVRVDWEGLPLGTIDFLESISVMYHRRVIAVARPMQDSIATESKNPFCNSISGGRNCVGAYLPGSSSSLDLEFRFGEFVSSVVTDSAVQVTLSAGRLRFHGLDRELSRNSGDSNIYRMETMLNLKGFDSFKDLVKIGHIRVTGSDPRGLFVEATAAITITNPTVIDITASFVVSVHYREAEDLRLQPGVSDRDRERVVNWRFQPPPPMANEDVKAYINRYMTTFDDIPVQLRLENQSITIGNYRYPLPPLVVQSTIRGLGSKFVQQAYARVGLKTVLNKKISFAFLFVNPLDTVLTIRAIEVDAYVLNTKLLSTREMFDGFTILPQKDSRSPEVKGTELTAGRISSLRGAIPGTTVNVDIKSATIYIGNFVLEGVRFNLKDIPFSLDH